MVNVSGLLVTIVSIASYNYLKITKMRREAREKLAKKVDDDVDEEIRGSGPRRRRRSRNDDRESGASDEVDAPLIEGDGQNYAQNQIRGRRNS